MPITNPSPNWTPEERLAMIGKICQRSYPTTWRQIPQNEVTWRFELILALTHESSAFLEDNRSNFEGYFDDPIPFF